MGQGNPMLGTYRRHVATGLSRKRTARQLLDPRVSTFASVTGSLLHVNRYPKSALTACARTGRPR